MRVLIAPDKFKGTLTAPEAAAAIARGWARARPADGLIRRPISDGGDGFGPLLGEQLDAQTREVATVDAAHRPLKAPWWWGPRERLAIVESAAVIGLARLPRGRFHPFALDTFGLGAVLRAVARARPRRVVIGIGGSATNDAGFGLARALGWRFYAADDEAITAWPELTRLARVTPPRRPLRFPELIVAVDVRNPLLGARGATRVYGPQKGLRPDDLPAAERALRQLARVLRAARPDAADPARQAGAGAAGGLGFGLGEFLGARREPGFALFARETDLPAQIRQADLVLTGEGALDLTSVAMGKGVGELARLCRRARVPCWGLAGGVEAHPRVQRAFARTAALTDLTTPAAAQRQAARWLARLAEHTARQWPAETAGPAVNR